MTTATLLHDCPLHAEDESSLAELSVYERRWLEIACADITFHEQHTPTGKPRTRRLIKRRCDRIRAEMRRILAHEPSTAPSVDLWA